MLSEQLKSFLTEHHIEYSVITHSPAFTAQETAAAAHISGDYIAKAVIVKLDGKFAMVLEPAQSKVDLKKLKKISGAKKVELASEYEFQDKFPECEVGAMPALGNIYHMDVYMDDSLLKDKWIAFCGGSHSELVKLALKDFKKWAKPIVLH